jgi:glycosyltransferase involved in cell wall biosynthesis
MRLLIVYNSSNDARSVSGVHRYFAGVVPEWIRLGHSVDFLVARAAWPVFRELYPKSQLISSDNFFDATRHLHQTWRYLPAFAWRMVTCHFARLPQTYDAVLACAQFIYEIHPMLTLARRMGAARAVKIHHVVSAQRHPAGLFDRMHFWSERTTARWLNREADTILVGTELIGRDFNALEARLGLTASTTHATGYGIDLEALPLAVDSPKEFDAVLLGRVHEHKGVFDVPELWRAVCARRPDARLLVIGEGPHREPLTQRCREAGLADRVVFTGGVTDAEKNRLLTRCRVGLSLSREEGWGLSVNEFLALGLPVVAMDLPVFRAVFPGQLDVVPQKNSAAVAERVVRWLEDPAGARDQGVRGREFVTRYDHRAVARHELDLLAAAIDRRRTRDTCGRRP